MRSPTKILITAAVAACAVGMSACQEQAAAPQDAGAPGTQDGRPAADPVAPASQGVNQIGVAGAHAIEPVTVSDQAIGLTESCDQVIPDFDASTYKAQSSAKDETVYLLHCTLNFTGDLSLSPETDHALSLVDDSDQNHRSYLSTSSDLGDDFERAGIKAINSDDYGADHVDGWYAFILPPKDGKPYHLPEDATTLVYERKAVAGENGGQSYEAYSSRETVMLESD